MPELTTAEKLLALRIKRVETIPDKFVSKVGSTQQEIFNELMIILRQLDFKDGTLLLNRENLVRIETLMVEYYEALRVGRYGALVSGFMAEFDKQKIISFNQNVAAFGSFNSVTADLVFNRSKTRAVELLLGDDFKTNFINIVRDQVVANVEGRATFKEMRTNLMSLFEDEERLPVMQNWASQVASDIFSLSDRGYNNEIAQDLGLVFGKYAKGTIPTSRPFCVERANRYFHIDEVKDWANLDPWKGRFRLTTEQNIIDWLGGYNCRHIFAYVSLIKVPETDLKRNVENGNFTPTAIEKDLLDI